MSNFCTVTLNSRVQSGEWRGQMGKLLLRAGVLRSGADTAGRIEPALGNAPICTSLRPAGSLSLLDAAVCVLADMPAVTTSTRAVAVHARRLEGGWNVLRSYVGIPLIGAPNGDSSCE